MNYSEILRSVIAGEHLSFDQTHWAFTQIMDGAWSEAQIAGLLVAMAAKGETADEIAGAARAMREHALNIDAGGAEVIDTCGTGGTGIKTFNVSTAAAFVAAGAGVKVAKHGNRTATRPSGSADVLSALGVNINASATTVARCLAQSGVCFCFAVACHPAMKHAAPVRRHLGVRTIFNLLGPLTNPASAKRQLMGVFSPKLTPVIAEVLSMLGSTRAMVVCAADGLDELSTTASTQISELSDGIVQTRTVEPEDFGLARAKLDDILISSPTQSAEVVRKVLDGTAGPARDIVVLNAAAALAVAGLVADIQAGIAVAQGSIDSGAAKSALKKLIKCSSEAQ